MAFMSLVNHILQRPPAELVFHSLIITNLGAQVCQMFVWMRMPETCREGAFRSSKAWNVFDIGMRRTAELARLKLKRRTEFDSLLLL